MLRVHSQRKTITTRLPVLFPNVVIDTYTPGKHDLWPRKFG